MTNDKKTYIDMGVFRTVRTSAVSNAAPSKSNFHAIFRHGQRLVAEPGPTPSPWSITKEIENLRGENGMPRFFQSLCMKSLLE